jgi:phenylalanyl-tRNA synthetase alpha chain
MLDELKKLKEQALAVVEAAGDLQALAEARTRYLGRKGLLSQLLRKTGSLPPEQRPEFGKLGNLAKNALEKALAAAEERLSKAGAGRSGRPGLDVSLPGIRPRRGRLHPITQTERLILEVFTGMGYEIVETRQVEADWYNFEALNFPPDHPARDMQDTFFVGDQGVLRTHTSPAQVRVMESRQPPIRIVCPGKVYRRDSDISHTPMFHQVEGLVVGEDISFADLKGTLITVVKRIFGPEVPVRFRSSFFPFTEPSAEVDIGCVVCGGKGCRTCSQTGWLEILGSGMVDPNVFKNVGYDPERYTGFAFGMGIERIAMLLFGIDDIRLYFENDLRFTRQF